MENISKALIIAGTIIITVMLMTLLWNLYSNFQKIHKIDDETEKFEQDTEYNKKFRAFNRSDVKGIDILSLYNLVEDYNLREVTNPTTSGINVTINITKSTDYFKKGNYKIEEINKTYEEIEQEISKLLEEKVDYFAGLTEDELNNMKAQNPIKLKDIDSKIEAYNKYKKGQDEFKQKKFKCVNIEYKNQSVTKMEFTE